MERCYKKRNSGYYNLIARASDGLQEMARLLKMTRPPSIPMLSDLERSIGGIQEQVRLASASIHHIESTLGRTIREANLQMSSMLPLLKPCQDIAKQIQEERYRVNKHLRSSIGGVSQMLRSALLAQQSVANINLKAEGAISEAVNIMRNEPLIKMANSYRHLWDTLTINLQGLSAVPLVVTKKPSIEMYLATHQAEVSTIEGEILPEEEKFLSEIEPADQHMHKLITSVDEHLLPMYQGAIAASKSHNDDYVRHVAISLRELFTHILHKLAPDEVFFKWNQDESNIGKEGRPTRKGRLRYICRKINYGEFNTFVEQDISTALSFLNLLQKGSHAIQKPYSKRQLRALFIRAKCLLGFIIEISRDV